MAPQTRSGAPTSASGPISTATPSSVAPKRGRQRLKSDAAQVPSKRTRRGARGTNDDNDDANDPDDEYDDYEDCLTAKPRSRGSKATRLVKKGAPRRKPAHEKAREEAGVDIPHDKALTYTERVLETSGTTVAPPPRRSGRVSAAAPTPALVSAASSSRRREDADAYAEPVEDNHGNDQEDGGYHDNDEDRDHDKDRDREYDEDRDREYDEDRDREYDEDRDHDKDEGEGRDHNEDEDEGRDHDEDEDKGRDHDEHEHGHDGRHGNDHGEDSEGNNVANDSHAEDNDGHNDDDNSEARGEGGRDAAAAAKPAQEIVRVVHLVYANSSARRDHDRTPTRSVHDPTTPRGRDFDKASTRLDKGKASTAHHHAYGGSSTPHAPVHHTFYSRDRGNSTSRFRALSSERHRHQEGEVSTTHPDE
ncbi:hypothetical protein CVT25_010444, partial [Psilocybe cyanescens]